MVQRAGRDKRATRARRQGVGVRRSTQAPADRAVGHLGWLQKVLPSVGMTGSSPIWARSGVGEGILGREKDEREGEKRKK